MKRILITGANSYIGTSFEAYLKNFRVHFNNKFKGYEELHHEISANALTYSIPPDYSYVEPVYYHNIQNIKDAVRYQVIPAIYTLESA